jgi:hypothetical protein
MLLDRNMQRMTHEVRSTIDTYDGGRDVRRITLPATPYPLDTERRDTAPSPRMIRIDPEEQEE